MTTSKIATTFHGKQAVKQLDLGDGWVLIIKTFKSGLGNLVTDVGVWKPVKANSNMIEKVFNHGTTLNKDHGKLRATEKTLLQLNDAIDEDAAVANAKELKATHNVIL